MSSRHACLAVALATLSGCGGGLGSMTQNGQLEVYYKDGATKEEADKLAAFLVKVQGAATERRTVQLQKVADGYAYRMVTKKEFRDNAQLPTELQFLVAKMSREVFGGAKVEAHICDELLNTFKVVPARPDVRYHATKANVEVFYATEGQKADAERLADYLAKILTGATLPMYSYKLAMRDQTVEVHMVADTTKIKDPAIQAALRVDREAIATNVFPKQTVELHLCDAELKVIEVLKP